MNACTEVLITNDGAIDFCLAYFKSIPGESPQLARFSRLVLRDPDAIHTAPRVTELYPLMYKRNTKAFSSGMSLLLLPAVSAALMEDHTTHQQFIRDYLKSADEMCLFTLVELVCKHIMYHIELQE
jgi:hypothetical protein